VALADGRTLPFDGLVTPPAPDPGIRAPSTSQRPLDLSVVGAGFIGAEVAASCRERGVEVTMVEPLAAPLARVLGPGMGGVVADLHREHGVDLRLETGVSDIAAGEVGAPLQVTLTDETTVEADLVVVGIGVTPNTDWLHESELLIEDGVLCDATTLAAPGVVACGDVARWPNPLFGEVMRVEQLERLDMGARATTPFWRRAGRAVPRSSGHLGMNGRSSWRAGFVRPTDRVAAEAQFCAPTAWPSSVR
jgi:3-phenylpropionate/trans-cinnamate dioxygenase ferredoxin reductase subunit